MSLTRFFFYTFFYSLFTCTVNAQGYLKAEGKAIVNNNGEVIPKGFGLGGWMLQEPYMLKLSGVAAAQYEIKTKIKDLIGEAKTNSFYDAWLSGFCTKADIDSMAAWGMNSVRLPMHYNLYTLPIEEEKIHGNNTWLEKGFALTDSLLNWCKSNHMYLILDLHAAPGGQGNDNAISDRDTSKPSLWQNEMNRQKTIALWKKLAARYANEEWIGGYDIINEPNWGFDDKNDRNGCNEKSNVLLRQLYMDITRAIREADKNHIIIIEGNCWGNNYQGMFPLWDNNIVLSFHKYWNINQVSSIQYILDLREKYNVPIWLGETGENSNAWLTDMVTLMKKNGIGWNIWPLKKAGLNNPLQINPGKGFHDITSYWNGESAKPDKETSFASLMQLAKNTRNQNNLFQKGFIDAITRQVENEESIPFKDNVIRPGTIIFATDYDLGRSGIAYHDTDSADYWVSTSAKVKWNEGGEYRNDGVDIQPCTDAVTNGYNISWINDGEWMQYHVYSGTNATYDINIRTAVESGSATLKILVNNEFKSEVLSLPSTGNFQSWQTNTIKTVRLSKGWNSLKVLAVKGGFNLNYLQFILPTNSEVKTD